MVRMYAVETRVAADKVKAGQLGIWPTSIGKKARVCELKRDSRSNGRRSSRSEVRRVWS